MSDHTRMVSRCPGSAQRLLTLAVLVSVFAALLPWQAAAQGPAFHITDVSSIQWDMAAVGGKVIYAMLGDTGGREPWCADAATGSAHVVKDIAPGGANSDPDQFVGAGDVAYFVADNAGGTGLWVTDCTEGGTVLLHVFTASPYGMAVGRTEGSLVFSAYDWHYGYELWTSDGTEAGTLLLKDIAPGGTGSAPDQFTVSGGLVYFTANDGEHGEELWVTDGTEAGTHLVKDLTLGSSGSYILGLADLGGAAYFLAYSGGVAIDLWRSDGTAAGTQVVAPIADISEAWWWYSDLVWMEPVGDALYVYYLDPEQGVRIWVSDGTAAGTHRIEQLAAGDGRLVVWAASDEDVLYYPGHSATAGTELWRTDGTPAGTWMVKDINPGVANSLPTEMLQVRDNGLKLFAAASDATGMELWATDGTEAGTRLWHDIVPGEGSSNPTLFVLAGDFVYFLTGTDGQGWQLWATRVEPPSDGTALFFPAIRH
ncbi:MAG: ELWxxDGT repeat protein [Anaerolineae bacterium]